MFMIDLNFLCTMRLNIQNLRKKMKKYLIIGAVLTSSLFAANNAQIQEYFQGQVPPQIKVEVIGSEKIKELPKYELVSIKLSEGKKEQILKMFEKDGMLFPEIIDLKSQTSMLKKVEKRAQIKALKDVYKKEDKSNIISIGNSSSKETMVVFTDPECPYCRNELKNIEKRLEKANIKILLTPVHGKSSLEKSALIYEHIKNAKSDKDKIAILKKYYAPDVDISKEKVSDKQIAQMEDFRRKYLASAIKGVPYIVKEQDIK